MNWPQARRCNVVWLLLPVLLCVAGCQTARARLASPEKVEVDTVRHANSCDTQLAAARLTLFSNLAAVDAWRSTADQLFGDHDDPLDPGAYLLVEHGRRDGAGYGVLVSRPANFKNGVLTITATFVSPPTGSTASDEPSSPCVLVALPEINQLRSVVLLDQGGVKRAETHASFVDGAPVISGTPVK